MQLAMLRNSKPGGKPAFGADLQVNSPYNTYVNGGLPLERFVIPLWGRCRQWLIQRHRVIISFGRAVMNRGIIIFQFHMKNIWKMPARSQANDRATILLTGGIYE